VLDYDSTQLTTSQPVIVCDKLTISLSGCGNSKTGSFQIYVKTFK
jgi:hypothetical protein